MACDTFKRVAARIDSYRDDVIDLQRALIAIPAISPTSGGNGEAEKARFLTQYLHQHQLGQVEIINAPDPQAQDGSRPNIVCRMEGTKGYPTVWLMAHTDVVPAGDLSKWDSDPFTLQVEGDKLIGRGSEDNHQGLVAAVMAARAFQEEGITPTHSIGLLLVADEETGSKHGIDHILNVRPDLFHADDIIIVPDGGVPDGTQIEIAEKGIMWIRFTVTGKQCHASMPHKGINAHRAGAYLITLLDSLHTDFPQVDPVFDPPTSTFEPTQKEANVPNVNTIPGDDVFYLDCRVLPSTPLSEVISRIQELCDRVEEQFKVTIRYQFPQREDAAPPTPENAAVVTALKSAIAQVYDVQAKAQGIGGGTVAAYFRRRNLPVAVWARLDESMHGPNEYAWMGNILGDAKVFAHVICGCGL